MVNETRNVLSGQNQISASGAFADQIVSDAAARYYNMVKRGNVFFACNSAVQALSVNNATATGLILSNPVNSGKNLVLLEATIALASVPGAISEIVLTGHDAGTSTITHTTALTVRNALMGAGGGSTSRQVNVGLADSSATIPASPTVFRAFGSYLWIATAANVIGTPFYKDEIAGALVVGPGCDVSIQAVTTAISAICSMTWAEELI
jgi:hypothetical protein